MEIQVTAKSTRIACTVQVAISGCKRVIEAMQAILCVFQFSIGTSPSLHLNQLLDLVAEQNHPVSPHFLLSWQGIAC